MAGAGQKSAPSAEGALCALKGNLLALHQGLAGSVDVAGAYGEDEIAGGVVACKDLASGEQTKLDAPATIYRIKAGLAEREKGAVILE